MSFRAASCATAWRRCASAAAWESQPSSSGLEMAGSSPIRFEKDSENIVTVTFDAPGAPVNTMTEAWEAAFAATVERLAREKASIKGVILASAKKTFFAGAELKDVLAFGPDDGPKVFRWLESVKEQMRALETLGLPVGAALAGPAGGGGWGVAVAPNREDLCRRAREGIAARPSPKQPWDEDGFRMPGGGPSSAKVSQMLAIAPAMVIEHTRGLYPAPKAIMAAMVEGAYVDFDTALRIESRYFARLAVGGVVKNLVSLFFNRGAIKSGASRPKDVPKWTATKVGILGAGMMGGGIAWANMNRGVSCVLKDVSLDKAEAGKAYSEKILERRNKDKNPLMLIKATADMKELAGCDLIIEAVFEKRELKAQATKEAE